LPFADSKDDPQSDFRAILTTCFRESRQPVSS
jgi:hypothetical protein